MHELQRYPMRAAGADATHIISFNPTGAYSGANNALDKAIESQPGRVALVDGVITRKWFYIPLIYGCHGYEVQGNVLVEPRLR